MGRIVAFTDGGCRGNPGGIGAWAFVLVDEASRRMLERADAVDETTNNRMEMAAAIEALAAIRRMNGEVVVCTDSRYLVDCCSKWIRGWRARGWSRKEGSLKNVDLLQELDRLQSLHAVTWRWVQGHAGHRGNERVDQLANEAMDRRERGQTGRYERRGSWKGKLSLG